MSKKSVNCYVHLLKYVNANLIDLNGAIFISDFESSLSKAIKLVCPLSKIFESWLHYCQAIRQYITTEIKGLSAFLRDNKQASLQYHKILALPLLPRSYICSSFNDIKNEIENSDYHLQFLPFLQYFEMYWLEKVNVTQILFL